MVIIDFEASSLRKTSHPIEVAWGARAEEVRSFLLNPDYMAGWTDWNPRSVVYHGITRQELRTCGKNPRQVARQMVDELAGCSVYSDEPRYDSRWKDRLLSDAGLDPSLIGIKDLNLYLNRLIRNSEPCLTVVELLKGFSSSETGRHRAAADVRWLLEFVAYVENSVCKTSE
jgi:hypothetical protein